MFDPRRLLPPDPSAFYRVNEEVARELERLDRSGALDRLRGLLEGSGAELWVSGARPRDGLEELIGVLRPGPRGDAVTGVPELPPAPAVDAEGCSCGGDDESPAVASGARGGWDHAGVLATRSRFTVELPDGTAREVYMPDHVCPSCFNDDDNHIDACARVCARCAFRW